VPVLFTGILMATAACSSFQKTFVNDLNESKVLNNSFVGFVLMDPENNEILIEHQADKYFTPASNTKLFTFYAAEKILGDSIKAFEYYLEGDTIWLQGTGDPSFLHPDLPPSQVLDFLKGKQVVLLAANYPEPVYGPGWAWDDYDGSYQREKSSFPIHGNAVRIHSDSLDSLGSGLKVRPAYFYNSVHTPDTVDGPLRERNTNRFNYYAAGGDTVDIPFITDHQLIANLLEQNLDNPVTVQNFESLPEAQPFYSVPKDSLLRLLLQDSDNFIAEQLILQCSWELFGQLNSERALSYISDSLLAGLPQAPIWVDGSGLSRYNMFTPLSICTLLHKTYEEVPAERLFHLLPAGGVSGTIEGYYQAKEPYIFAKTGTLRHNHNLSGYLIAKSGKVLVFSFMHNHFSSGSYPIKKEMERLLWQIHLNY